MISSYDGTVRVVSTADKLPAQIALDHGELTISSGAHQIGRWMLDDVRVTRRRENAFHIEVEGDELALSVNDPTAFAAAIGIDGKPRRARGRPNRRRFRRTKDATTATAPAPRVRPAHQAEHKREGPSVRKRFTSLPLGWRLVIVVAPPVIALAIIDLFTLAALMVLCGIAVLVYTVFALSDDPTVYVPQAGVPEWAFPVSGVVLVVVGIALMMLT
jgi:hypothetical protein